MQLICFENIATFGVSLNVDFDLGTYYRPLRLLQIIINLLISFNSTLNEHFIVIPKLAKYNHHKYFYKKKHFGTMKHSSNLSIKLLVFMGFEPMTFTLIYYNNVTLCQLS